MNGFEVPELLAAGVERSGDERRRQWLRRLPDLVAVAADRWSLEVGRPYQPGGECSWTAPARGHDGRRLVLKVAWWTTESVHEADGLRLWGGAGAVEVHGAERLDDQTDVLLLERAEPGTLLTALPEPEQDEVLAGLLRRLWVVPPAGHGFRPLSQMCDEWAAEVEADPPPTLDAGVVAEGLAAYRALPREPTDQVLLPTDLHAGNVVASDRTGEPWLAIDPKPYVGEPAYDVTQHLLNCRERVQADLPGLCDRMAALCRLDPDRLRRWVFARFVVESTWGPWLVPVVERLARTRGVT